MVIFSHFAPPKWLLKKKFFQTLIAIGRFWDCIALPLFNLGGVRVTQIMLVEWLLKINQNLLET